MTKQLHAVPSGTVVHCGVIRETKRGRCFHSAGGTEGLSEIDVNHSRHLPEGTAGSDTDRTEPGQVSHLANQDQAHFKAEVATGLQ